MLTETQPTDQHVVMTSPTLHTICVQAVVSDPFTGQAKWGSGSASRTKSVHCSVQAQEGAEHSDSIAVTC